MHLYMVTDKGAVVENLVILGLVLMTNPVGYKAGSFLSKPREASGFLCSFYVFRRTQAYALPLGHKCSKGGDPCLPRCLVFFKYRILQGLEQHVIACLMLKNTSRINPDHIGHMILPLGY